MSFSIGKRVVLIFLVAMAFLTLLPLDEHAAENSKTDHAALNRSTDSPALQTANPFGLNSMVHSRWDIYEIVFGMFLSLIGFALIVLSLLRWKTIDLSLISFGALCLLYSARTKSFQFLFDIPIPVWSYIHWFITYLVPIPAWIFAEHLIGKGCKSSLRRLWQVQIVFSISAIAVSGYLQEPHAAAVGNNIIVVVGIIVLLANFFQPSLQLSRELKILKFGFVLFGILALYENSASLLFEEYRGTSLEDFGFAIFIGCLIYVVIQRFFHNEKKLMAISHELETARQIQSFILPGETVHIEGLSLAARYVPMASVAGDFYDFIKVDEKRLGILVADVSGHGVPASLISSMVKIAFASNSIHAADPTEMLVTINRVLCGKLENDFVTAGYLFLDTDKNIMTYAGAGHMPLLLWRPSEKNIYEFREKGTILGQFEDIQYKNTAFALKPGDRIILYTDGIVEASNPAHALFGLDRFKKFIRSQSALPAGQFADALIRQLFKWTGKRTEDALDDDLTLIVADYQHV